MLTRFQPLVLALPIECDIASACSVRIEHAWVQRTDTLSTIRFRSSLAVCRSLLNVTRTSLLAALLVFSENE